MLDILIIIGCIGLGMAVGFWRRLAADFLRLADRVALCAVYGLLFVLGARLGSDAMLLADLPAIGGRALCIAFFCTAGSVICLTAARRFFPVGKRRSVGGGGASASALGGSLRILGCFSLGIILAYVSLVPVWINRPGLATYALYLLVFAVGIGLGADLKVFRVLRDLGVGILAAPLLVVAGTIVGALAAALVLPGMGARDCLSVGAGLGYYSLSSIMIENAGHSALASVALLANIMREVMALLGAPLLARLCGPLAPVAAAGATAMDTTLPVIARFSGEQAAVVAVFSGMTLTLLVPLLVGAALLL